MSKGEYSFARLHFWVSLILTLLGADWYLSSELAKYDAYEQARTQQLARVYTELDSIRDKCRGN